jgi:ATP-dependent RNA helicase DOB1
VQVSLKTIQSLSAIRLNLPRDLTKEAGRTGVLKALQEVQRRYAAEGVPLLDPVSDMGITSDAFKTLQDRELELQGRLQSNQLSQDPPQERNAVLAAYGTRVALLEEARLLRHQARESQAVHMREDLRRMKRVLKRLGYITPEGVLGPKGRFSCELSTGDELVLTDMIFDGVFNPLTVEQAVALLSCFVHKEASKDEKVQEDLKLPFQQLQMAARNVAKVSIDAKMTLEEEEYVASFNPGMVSVVYAWCQGSKFADICALTNIFEGSIIRNIRRLEELLRQLASASLAIGNQELKAKFEQGADKIRRGVVFAASLYL